MDQKLSYKIKALYRKNSKDLKEESVVPVDASSPMLL